MALLVSHKGAIALHLPHLPYIFHEIVLDPYTFVEDGRCGRCIIWIGLQAEYSMQKIKQDKSFMKRLEKIKKIAAVL